MDGAKERDTATGKPWIWGGFALAGLVAALAVFAFDQLNKWWMINVYEIGARGVEEPFSFMKLMFVLNTGVSYGFGAADSMAGQYAWAAFALGASIVLWVLLIRSPTRIGAIGYGLIIGGALGNAVDRLHLGGVADFYLLHGFGLSTNVFNVADMAIVAGVIALLYDLFVVSRSDAAKQA